MRAEISWQNSVKNTQKSLIKYQVNIGKLRFLNEIISISKS